MSVQFDEDNFARKTYTQYSSAAIDNGTADARGMAKWLIDNGFATSIVSANIILIILFLIVLMISIYVFKNGLTIPGTVEPVQQIGPVPLIK